MIESIKETLIELGYRHVCDMFDNQIFSNNRNIIAVGNKDWYIIEFNDDVDTIKQIYGINPKELEVYNFSDAIVAVPTERKYEMDIVGTILTCLGSDIEFFDDGWHMLIYDEIDMHYNVDEEARCISFVAPIFTVDIVKFLLATQKIFDIAVGDTLNTFGMDFEGNKVVTVN